MSDDSSESEKKAASPAKRAAVALAIFVGLTGLIFLLEPDDLYLWIKAVHVIAVISWMAGMLYLPRLFVYHSEVDPQSDQSKQFKLMSVGCCG